MQVKSKYVAPKKMLSQSSTDKAINFKTTELIIAIGASTGGTEAIKDILCQLPPDTPGIVISQHIPGAFSAAFAQRLNQNSGLSVSEAINGQQILPGHVYLAPGGKHLEVKRDGARFICRVIDTEPVNRHKPSVEVMFKSVAENAGSNSICVLLTGMGDDGSEAMGIMKNAGAPTIAQDEQSSVVWGMPGEAVRRGYADDVLPLHHIAEKILYYVSRHGK
jgi:two-component system chemotaxis response regulator CheB